MVNFRLNDIVRYEFPPTSGIYRLFPVVSRYLGSLTKFPELIVDFSVLISSRYLAPSAYELYRSMYPSERNFEILQLFYTIYDSTVIGNKYGYLLTR